MAVSGAVWNATWKSNDNNLILGNGVINFTFGATPDEITTRSFDVTDGIIDFALADGFAVPNFCAKSRRLIDYYCVLADSQTGGSAFLFIELKKTTF